MKEAARLRRLSAAALSARLGVTRVAVYRWWSGDRRPEEEDMDRYAALVGRSAQFLWTGVDPLVVDTVEEQPTAPAPFRSVVTAVRADAENRAMSNEELAGLTEHVLQQLIERLRALPDP